MSALASESYWKVELSNLQQTIANRHDALVTELAKAGAENLRLLKDLGKKDVKIAQLEDTIRYQKQEIGMKENELADALKKINSMAKMVPKSEEVPQGLKRSSSQTDLKPDVEEVEAPGPKRARRDEAPESTSSQPITRPVHASRLESTASGRHERKAPIPVSIPGNPPPESSPVTNIIRGGIGSPVVELAKIPDHVRSRYIDNTRHLIIQPPPTPGFCVTRSFLEYHYGTHPRALIHHFKDPCSPVNVVPTTRAMICPIIEQSPGLPIVPGRPGLLFSSHDEIFGDPKIKSLFVRMMNSTELWMYMGEYEFEFCSEHLTGNWFAGMAFSLRRSWARLILNTTKVKAYNHIKARISLRKKGVHLTSEIVEAEANSGAFSLTEDEIIEVISSGVESIGLVHLKCVRYDHQFAADMELRSTRESQSQAIVTASNSVTIAR